MKKILLVILLTLFTFSINADHYVDINDDTIDAVILPNVPDTSLLKHFYGKDTLLINSNQFVHGDTIYIKHEDKTCKELTIWDKWGRLIEALLSLLVGGGVAWITSYINTNAEKEKLKIIRETDRKNSQLHMEKELFRQLKNLAVVLTDERNPDVESALAELSTKLNDYQISIRPELFEIGNNFYAYLLKIHESKISVDRDVLAILSQEYINKFQSDIKD